MLVRPAFLLIAVIFGAQGGTAADAAAWVGIVFASVLIHELGHAAAMRAFGFSPRIELHAMGGFTAWSLEKKPGAGQRVVVTFCGPLAGLALGGLAILAQRLLGPDAAPVVREALRQAIWVNIGWSFVNLIPVLPWDGGLILDGAVELVARRPLPKVAAVSSLVFGALVVAFALWQRSFVMLVYFGGVGIWQGYLRLQKQKPPDPALDQVWALMQAQKFPEAERLAVEKAVGTPDVETRGRLYEAVAWSRLFRDDWRGAERAIEQMGPVPPQLPLAATLAAHTGRHAEVLALLPSLPDDRRLILLRTDAHLGLGRPEAVVTDAIALLARNDPAQQKLALDLGNALFEARAFEPALQVFLSGFQRVRSAVFLFNAACAEVKLGLLDAALATLGRAIDAGYRGRDAVANDPDLAPLRTLPGWEALLGKLAP